MARPIVDAEYLKEIERARRDLCALISSKNCAPIMLRLATPRSLQRKDVFLMPRKVFPKIYLLIYHFSK
ncbi:unnamed protein product [Cuscuta campestris]|uniref:Uncharacterized protein n=1 Tax=Cuscuta campestris TaxID=132261 RepID=A0A484M339_9ASTE|nr:unnamed protein product [Cuscuta campestris]